MNLGGSHISLASRPLGNVRVGPDPVGHVAIPFAVPEQAMGSSAPTMWVDVRAVDPTPGTVKRDRSGNGNDWTHAVVGGGGLAVGATSAGAPALVFTESSAERLNTPSIDLTATDEATVAIVFDSASVATGIVAEFSTNYSTMTDGFVVVRTAAGQVESDCIGNVGFNLFLTDDAFGASQTILFAIIDKSVPLNETLVWADGSFATGTKSGSANNTNSFGNHAFFVGDRSGGTAFPAGMRLAHCALWDRRLSASELPRIWAALKSIAG